MQCSAEQSSAEAERVATDCSVRKRKQREKDQLLQSGGRYLDHSMMNSKVVVVVVVVEEEGRSVRGSEGGGEKEREEGEGEQRAEGRRCGTVR